MNHASIATLFALLFSTTSVMAANTACDGDGPLTVISATDDGLFEETHGPDNTIDGDFDPDSRWSNESQGTAKELLLDLGAKQTLKSLSIAWHKGDSRKSEFSVEVSEDNKAFTSVIAKRQSGGTTLDLEAYDFDDVPAQYIKLTANGNESNNWNSIVEIQANGCGVAVEKPDTPVMTEAKGKGLFGLHTDKPPGHNFDLKAWYMTTPADDDKDGKSDSVYENELAAGWVDPRYFYTDPATGGMVFRSTPAGAKTSKNTKYTRSELRGMLREGNESVETRLEGGIPNKNNWVFSSAPESAQAKAGGVDGVLKATLAVNQVTRQGKAYQVGRVIIGQIHAKDDEPIRLYYRKLPRNKYGSIYFAHEPATGKEQWVEIIGSRGDRAANPENGIALDELFSYEIEVKGEKKGDKIAPMLHVKITRDDGSEVSSEPYDMSDSGFSVEDEFMFFKAGAYSQNNTSPEPETDFDRVIFYKLAHSHGASPGGAPAKAAKVEAKKEAAPATTPAAMPASTDTHPAAVAGVIANDSFEDGQPEINGGTETNWWTTTNSSALEVEEGALGLVSGGSGRGIRTTFPAQALADGQTIKATFSFTTPKTIGSNRDSAFRVGLYDKLNRIDLEQDQSASSKKPNVLYDALPGYMIDFDINLKDPTKANIDVRKHTTATHGRLLGTTKGYQRIGGGGDAYQFAAEQSYTGTMAIKRVGDNREISGSLSQDGKVLSEFTHIDEGSQVNNFGMLAFHVNSKTFGSSKKKGEPDNGLDFSNVTIEVLD
uniref:Alginate lyase (EC) n=1 Tax=uncultured Thiotrichaceae bacterium TaxID=298394 RepID=A0A6S6UB56_9GAMM|nr:MAG: Alginate lyase precursor (EC [uncultured Thiotrichaceae bacterium]